jgi:hypothetical protein
MDLNFESTTVEDFDDNQPRKKSKSSESLESISSESDEPSPTKSALSPVSELMNEETISTDDDDRTFLEDNAKLPDKPKHIINNVTYDNLPQGNILAYSFHYRYLLVSLLHIIFVLCRLYIDRPGSMCSLCYRRLI